MHPSRIDGIFYADRPVSQAMPVNGFVACPVPAGAGGFPVQEVYRLAYESARAAVMPTWLERVMVPSSN